MRFGRLRIAARHTSRVFKSSVVAGGCCLAVVSCSPGESFKADEPTGAAHPSTPGTSTGPVAELPEEPVGGPSPSSEGRTALAHSELVGTWEISPGSASRRYYSLEIERDGAASTVGEPLANRGVTDPLRVCGGTAHLTSTPVSMTLTCADLEKRGGQFHHVRRHAGELHLGQPPSLLLEYGDVALVIEWANGKTDYLFPGNI